MFLQPIFNFFVGNRAFIDIKLLRTNMCVTLSLDDVYSEPGKIRNIFYKDINRKMLKNIESK